MTGYLGPNGVVRSGPPLRGAAKRQVTLRLDPDVIKQFREGGPGWQADERGVVKGGGVVKLSYIQSMS